MAKYEYEAMNSKEAISMLRGKGLFPTKVRHVAGEELESVPDTNEKPEPKPKGHDGPEYMFGIEEYKCKYVTEAGEGCGF